MKATARFITVMLGFSVGLASMLLVSGPAMGQQIRLDVTLSAPIDSSPKYNAIAGWNPEAQSACLYSANELQAPANSSEPWVKPANCINWTPPSGTLPGIYDATWDSGKSRALLVISDAPKKPSHSSIAVIVPDYTWQAYDLVKGGSFYFEAVGKKSTEFSMRRLNLLRPLNFVRVGDPKNYPTTPQVFPEVNPISFLRGHFGEVDVIAQSKLDEANYDLSAYRTIVVYGHDEYWTAKVKSDIETAVANGTALLNLSGNTGYRKLVRTGSVLGFDPASAAHPSTSRWGDKAGDTTPIPLIGAEYLGEPFNKRKTSPIQVSERTFRGLTRDGLPANLTKKDVAAFLEGMKVRDGADPLFADTGLRNGDFIGVNSHVMSVEVDAIPEDASGKIEPDFIKKFGTAPISAAADVWVNARKDRGQLAWRAGTLIRTQFGRGKVFTAGPIGWTASLVGGDRLIQIVTLNAMRWLGQVPVR